MAQAYIIDDLNLFASITLEPLDLRLRHNSDVIIFKQSILVYFSGTPYVWFSLLQLSFNLTLAKSRLSRITIANLKRELNIFLDKGGLKIKRAVQLLLDYPFQMYNHENIL